MHTRSTHFCPNQAEFKVTSLDQAIGVTVLEVDTKAIRRAQKTGAVELQWQGLPKTAEMLDDYDAYESTGKVSLMPLWSGGRELWGCGTLNNFIEQL